MITHYIWFAGQYGNTGRWHTCTVDKFGVWRCGGMYIDAFNNGIDLK